MKKGIKNALKRVRTNFNKIIDIATLNSEIIYLKNELEESKNKEKPYIDTIQALRSDNRVLKILNTKLEKKAKKLEQEIAELENNSNVIFERQ